MFPGPGAVGAGLTIECLCVFVTWCESTAEMRPELEDSNRAADVIHDSSSQSVAALDEDVRDGCTLEPFRNGCVIGE
jgi:hypothetical protein